MSEKGDLYRIIGSDDYTTGVPARYLKLGAIGSDMPNADDLCDLQIKEAIYRIHEDTSAYPRYPWSSLDVVAGAMCPEDLIIATARTGGGKSLFLQNLFDGLIHKGHFGLYAGLEQNPTDLRTKWACLAHDIPPKLILSPEVGEQGSAYWQRSMDLVQQHLAWQKTPDIRKRAHFATARKINAKGLLGWTEWAVDHGAEFIIVDHIDRVEHGEGKNSFHEMSQTIRLAKELAMKHRIVMILASQLGRPTESIEQYFPPDLHNMRGGGTKEEEADKVLGIFRPLRDGVGLDDLRLIRQGLKTKEDVVEPNMMGVSILKHRLDGTAMGKIVKLGVKHQKVFELPERDRHSTIYGGKNL